ncbi:DUF2804 family protein [Mycobacterium koreense]|uniref:Uncharacterized protein n=1 Tax=Mycolicibacillus koreensis TaxID=1069220 RepID=A0A7I7SAI2_9MYCO|nr:DUF2804 family protein [Mycolicibacillus koreensis]MCV7249294.1 DUF2804 family protein [Mycolicibacillus koreensis]OSC35558.1 hypothetical protein B8W67_02215 [Mycolicibacillus koreensis]BBY53206.1 hypothetical protein MKOR_04570 [Mycolicibacillus koreensis]
MLTPDHLVGGGVRRYGRFAQRFRDTNPLDAYRGIARLWHRWRLKEWVGFTLIHPQLSGAMIMQDAKYLASSELFVRDRSTGGAAEKAVTLRGGGVTLPDELLHGGTCTVAKRGYLLRYDFDERAGTGTVQFDCAADASGPAISGTLTLHLREAAPALSISAKITPSIDYYTFKQPFPVQGTLTLGEHRYRFDPERDFAIIDENRSHFPYSTSWTWGTFATRAAGGIVGSSFVDRAEFSDADDESSNWVPGQVEPLAGIEFDCGFSDPAPPGRVRDRDGRLDVTFTPDWRKDVKVNLLAAAIDYTQLSGTYCGTVTSLAGETVRFDAVPGVLERMRTRF